jgi:hypothetical protein
LRGGGIVVLTASVRSTLLGALLCAAACYAQPRYEFGGAIGYGINRNGRINAPAGEAQVGIRNRFVAGAVFCEDLYDYFSGEIRYLYHDGDPFISAGGRTGNIQGQSHAFSYDVLIHARDRDQRLRPYVAVGIGAKYYRATGPEPTPQPAPQIAELVREDHWRLLVEWGIGAKYRWHRNVILRADFRHLITPFPGRLFVPAGTGSARGLFQQFAPMFGVSYSF